MNPRTTATSTSLYDGSDQCLPDFTEVLALSEMLLDEVSTGLLHILDFLESSGIQNFPCLEIPERGGMGTN